MEILPSMPEGYRWATEDEVDHWDKIDGAVQVRVGGNDDSPMTDIAVPRKTRDDRR